MIRTYMRAGAFLLLSRLLTGCGDEPEIATNCAEGSADLACRTSVFVAWTVDGSPPTASSCPSGSEVTVRLSHPLWGDPAWVAREVVRCDQVTRMDLSGTYQVLFALVATGRYQIQAELRGGSLLDERSEPLRVEVSGGALRPVTWNAAFQTPCVGGDPRPSCRTTDGGVPTDLGAPTDLGDPLMRADRVELDVGPLMRVDVGPTVFADNGAPADVGRVDIGIPTDVPAPMDVGAAIDAGADARVDVPTDVPSCPSGGAFCGGACRNAASDDTNCGGCGVVCQASQRCVFGECLRRFGELIGSGGRSLQCGNGDTDIRDPAGGTGSVCVHFRCRPPRGTCNGSCTELSASRLHCGRCNNACPAGQNCVAGACQTTACGDLMTDPTHCGSCSTVCPGDQRCIAGACACPTGTQLCGGACIETLFNDRQCGACGRACPSTQRCAGGTCQSGCDVGRTACPQPTGGPVCSILNIDSLNCGACGTVCPTGSTCGRDCPTCPPQCRPSCNADRYPCPGGACLGLHADNSNCGGCGVVCRSPQYCRGGACG